MSAVEMSLDDIIAMTKKSKRGGGIARGGRGNKQLQTKRSYRDLDAPEEPRRTEKPQFNGGNPNAIVRINLSNLAPSVSSADLEELFEEFAIEAATVHFNEHGHSLGTGDVFLRRRDAARAIQNFKGVALDNEVLHMHLVDGSQNIASRVSSSAPRRVGGGSILKRGSSFPKRNDRTPRGGRGAVARRNGREKPKVKTTEELDAELDAYMMKSD